jgi:hypothetical protein
MDELLALLIVFGFMGGIVWLMTRSGGSSGATSFGGKPTCHKCHGTGKVPVIHWVHGSEYEGSEACGFCNGKGKLKQKIHVEDQNCPHGCHNGFVPVPSASGVSRFSSSQDGKKRVRCKYMGETHNSDNGYCGYNYTLGYSGETSYLFQYSVSACNGGRVRVKKVTQEPF